MEHLIFRWPEAENFRTDEETNSDVTSPFCTMRWRRGCYCYRNWSYEVKTFRGTFTQVWVGNSYDLPETVRIAPYVTLLSTYDSLTACLSYGYISNISSVYVNVYVSEMCVNTHLHKTGVLRIKTWLSKTKKAVKLVRVCAVEPSKRSFDSGTWLWNTTERNPSWHQRLVELSWWGNIQCYH